MRRLSVACLLALWACGGSWNVWTQGIGPGQRAAHSLHVYKDSLYLFGGRSNDIIVPHRPKTYTIVETAGVLSFASYDQQLVKNCSANDTALSCLNIPVGSLHNDLWTYPLNCLKYDDYGCAQKTWELVFPQAANGGCDIVNGVEFCTHPSERYDHGSTVFPDGTLMVYGGFSQRCDDYCSDMWTFNISKCVNSPFFCHWYQTRILGRSGPGQRWRMAGAETGTNDWYIFGGNRIWQGMAPLNSITNRWNDTTTFPYGGYLDDLWHYYFPTDTWTQILPQESCFKFPGASWDQRNNYNCTVFWPTHRSGGVLTLAQGLLWLHGGFTVTYPYPNVASRGGGPGTAELAGIPEYAPYPTLPYYLDDMWIYNFTSGLWVEITPTSTVNPSERRGHSMVLSGSVFLMFGGYSNNFYNQEFWFYNLTTNSWLQKFTFNRPLLPATCTDDTVNGRLDVMGEPTRFTTLDGAYGRASQRVLIPQERRSRPGWDGCRDRWDMRDKRIPPDGYSMPNDMVWLQPSQRSNHRMAYYAPLGYLALYGGDAYVVDQLAMTNITYQSTVKDDLWVYQINKCSQNCSNHGTCYYGYCFCDAGWYGVDCSNISCPGDYCYYDPLTMVQQCTHCCHASYAHVDGEYYVANERKVACDANQPGESHGICDGFGQCQCAPPFIGDDCSIKDCANNCSGWGVCSVEYPVSRCLCDGTRAGLDCSRKLCLNNCTYPNGECVDGQCFCNITLNPYNNSRFWKPYGGSDCSFQVPFAGASQSGPCLAVLGITLIAAFANAIMCKRQEEEAAE